jgi:hypothetical protein
MARACSAIGSTRVSTGMFIGSSSRRIVAGGYSMTPPTAAFHG